LLEGKERRRATGLLEFRVGSSWLSFSRCVSHQHLPDRVERIAHDLLLPFNAPLFASQGTERNPYFPRPLISDLDINMPLLNMANSAGQLEEK